MQYKLGCAREPLFWGGCQPKTVTFTAPFFFVLMEGLETKVLVGESDASLDLIDHAHVAPDEDERDEALREDVASSLTGAAEAR